MKRHIPNLITLANLGCGVAGVIMSFEGNWQWAVYLLLIAAVMDFLDGFAARALKAYSETGKQLDSLADLVSFGVLPGVMAYAVFSRLTGPGQPVFVPEALAGVMRWSILLIPILSAVRLARFNVAPEEKEFFYGLATPAHALFWAGLYWEIMGSGLLFGAGANPWFLWAIMLVIAFHMLVPVRMFSMKFANLSIRGNLWRYLLLLSALVLLILLGPGGFSLLIVLYIFLSLLKQITGS